MLLFSALAIVAPLPVHGQPGFAMVTGMFWRDFNGNGIRDPNEMTLAYPGQAVELWNGNGTTLLATTTTGSTGVYVFNYPATTSNLYRVRIRNRGAHTVGPKHAGENPLLDSDFNPSGAFDGYTDPIILTPGFPVSSIDAALDPININVGNFTWLDRNGDGIQNIDEPGVPNIAVELWSEDRAILYDQVISNDSGAYTAQAPGFGRYRLRFALPGFATFSP